MDIFVKHDLFYDTKNAYLYKNTHFFYFPKFKKSSNLIKKLVINKKQAKNSLNHGFLKFWKKFNFHDFFHKIKFFKKVKRGSPVDFSVSKYFTFSTGINTEKIAIFTFSIWSKSHSKMSLKTEILVGSLSLKSEKMKN